MTGAWQNWARTERSQPVLTIEPRSVDHVVLAVQRALETGHTLKPIGASHSFSGAGATDGIRLGMGRMRGLVDVDLARSRVTLWAGTCLWELPSILEPLGLALENIGDIDRQTISGATSTGTHGTGLRFGSLSTQIVGATLVDGTGTVRSIDEDHEPHLLPAVALGVGALGVLLTVTIQCVPRFVVRAVEAPLPFDCIVAEYLDRSRTADHFEFYWFPHTTTTRTKTNTRIAIDPVNGPRGDQTEPLGRIARFIDEELVNNLVLGAIMGLEHSVPSTTRFINRRICTLSSDREYSDESNRVFVTNRRVRFREMEYGLPVDAVPDALCELRNMIERRKLTVSFPVEVRSAAADPLLISPAHARETGYIAVHRYWRDKDHEYFREAEAVLLDHGGRPHWGKMHTQNAADFAAHYPEFDAFLRVRDELDPHRIFTNPYLERVLGS